jgi:hypothetical protein
METNMSPKVAKKFYCEKCNYTCSKLSDFNKHIVTRKHNLETNGNQIVINNSLYICDICNKKYSNRSGLWKHSKKCIAKQGPNTDTIHTNLINSVVSTENELVEIDKRDELIERLVISNTEMVTSSNEMKSMFQILLEKYHESQTQNQELMNKVIDVMPQIGNTTTNSHNTTNNNTLNFYLTNTCKDAESIHDFTDRFVKRSVEFFKGNYLDVAHNQIDLASNVYDIFKNCMDENPQTGKFMQTTDVKNGTIYIKEKPKDENKQLCGEAEFIKHMDGFAKAGTNISHAINCAFIPVQGDYKEIMERECGKEPKEDDYEDEDHYERDIDIYKEKTGDLKRHLLMQSFNAVCMFDAKKRRDEVMENTRRLKE